MGQGTVTETSDPETFHRVLRTAARVLEDAAVPHVVFGSIAVAIYGKPAPSGDVDVLVRPSDEERALVALADAGFDTDETDQTWMSKAFLDGVLVDVIVQLRGGLFLDDDVLGHARRTNVHGNEVTLISPEDDVLVEAASNSPEIQTHWYNAISILMRTPLDWRYLLERARLAPRRILSLLVYAEADDIEIPHDAIATLIERTYFAPSSGSIPSSR